ncbi:MAG: hypothetical protein ACNFW9_04945 [Candidatus Kerfeldbacteria bacterium]
MKLDQPQIKTKVSIEEKIIIAVMMGASLCLATGIVVGFFSTPTSSIERRIVKVTCTESKPLILEKPVADSTDIKEMISSMNKVNTDLRAALAAGKNVSTIQSLIIIRKQLLSDLMQMDSSAALESVFTKAELDKVNTYATNCSEILTTYDGKVYINTFDNFGEGISKDSYTFITNDDNSINLFPSVPPKDITVSSTTAEIIGYVLDDKLLLDGARNLIENPADGISGYLVTQDKSNTSYLGERKTIILKVNFANTSETSPEHETIGKVMDNTNDYYLENSYNQLSFRGVVNPGETADIYPSNPSSRYKVDFNTTCDYETYLKTFFEQSMQKAYDADDIDFTEYDHVVVVAPWQESDGSPCWWAAYASLGSADQDEMTIPGTNPGDEYEIGRVTLQSRYYPAYEGVPNYDSYFRQISINSGHELGHNFGNRHAAVLRCNAFTTPLSECVFDSGDEYRDSHEIMGNTAMSHYNALHKDVTGWFIDGTEIQTVDANGIYELYPIEIADRSKLKALKIPRGDDHYVYVEYRQPIGYDETSVNWSNLITGALVHTTERSAGVDFPNSAKSYLIDLCGPPYGECGNWFNAASRNVALQVGNSWTDIEANVKISPLSVSDDSVPTEERKLTVEIEYLYLCSTNSECDDGDRCTTDICADVGTADANCSNELIQNSCGDKVCGQSVDGCFDCGECEAGSYCMSGQCSTSTCEDEGGTCINKFINECDDYDLYDASGVKYYCSHIEWKCCIPEAPVYY